jgi:hypothetical protein
MQYNPNLNGKEEKKGKKKNVGEEGEKKKKNRLAKNLRIEFDTKKGNLIVREGIDSHVYTQDG